jgi:arsenate reductase
MAEAIVNARIPGWRAHSAGTHPVGHVHPMALAVLREIGIEHRGESKSAEQFREHAFEAVVTVCDEANEECPVWLGQGRRLHLSFPDPAKAVGSEDERLAAFRALRDRMLEELPGLLAPAR